MNFLTRALRPDSFPFNVFALKNRRRAAPCAGLERLEDRQLLTTFTVISTADTTDPGTLRWAIDQANNSAGADSIEFDSNSFSTPQTIILNGTALPALSDVSGSTQIVGPGADLLTISGNHVSRVFEVATGASATLQHVTVANGFAGEQDGGAILTAGTLEVEDVDFVANSATNGGAIAAGTDSNLTVESSTFTDNTATNGGALWVQNDAQPAVVSDVLFSHNTADEYGGGIYLSSGMLNILSTQFDDNTASFGGGVANPLGIVDISNSDFAGNSASQQGGGLWNGFFNDRSATARVTQSSFTDNSASDGGGIANLGILNVISTTFTDNSATQGGAINNQATLSAISSTFTTNHAAGDGGGLYSFGTDTLLLCTFTSNSADGTGGGVQGGNALYVEQSTFTSNTATRAGGLSVGSSTVINSSSFDQNVATYGGGIGAGNGSLQLSGTTFTDNQATYGAGIFNGGAGQINAVDITLTGNVATDHGGGIYNADITQVSIRSSTISGNTAAQGGGLFNDVQGSVAIMQCKFEDNSAQSGGALYNEGTGFLTATLTLVSGNSAQSGGGLFNFGTAQIDNSTFEGNSADNGGAIYHGHDYDSAASLLVVNVTIADNHATQAGGGIFQSQSNEKAFLANTIVGRNDSNGHPDDISGTIDLVRSVNNLIGPGGAGYLTSGTNGNIVVASNNALGLGTLGDNGGFMPSMPLLPGSPAVDAGSESVITPVPYRFYDQRHGLTTYRHLGMGVDIGAFESLGMHLQPSVNENTTFVLKILSNGLNVQPLTYAITGGIDSSLFTLDSATGNLSFVAAPDFENPQDADGDNIYEVQVTVTDGDGNTSAQLLSTQVQNVIEPPLFQLTSDPATYHIGGDPVVDSGAVFQADQAVTDFSLGKLVVTVPFNPDPKDTVELITKGKHAGPIRVKKNSILFNNVVVATIDKQSSFKTNLIIDFNSHATSAAVQAVVRQIGFSTKNKAPGQPPRTIQMQITDSIFISGPPVTRQINVVNA